MAYRVDQRICLTVPHTSMKRGLWLIGLSGIQCKPELLLKPWRGRRKIVILTLSLDKHEGLSQNADN